MNDITKYFITNQCLSETRFMSVIRAIIAYEIIEMSRITWQNALVLYDFIVHVHISPRIIADS